MIKNMSSETLLRIKERLNRLYGPHRADLCMERLAALVGRYGVGYGTPSSAPRWDEHSVLLITYADMVQRADENPLASLHRFTDQYLIHMISTIHLLPFFPFSSDDGFSVIDYRQVDSNVGTWDDVETLRSNFSLMFDLVLNHVSRHSNWFHQYVAGAAPYRDYFIEVDPQTDLSEVVRPRTSPLLTPVHKDHGEASVWTTFSEDQVDLNFSNPDVLFEFLDILFFYISKGAHILRLDAIAYLWKQIGTSCIHLKQTHEVVKLLRDLLDMVSPDVILLTETNVPHDENISYFGEHDEAHMIYQFSLPPLLLHALTTGNSRPLTNWAETVSEVPEHCSYLNFTASHDGIGVRPLSGLIPDDEFDALVERVQRCGGQVSSKKNSDGTESPYELNITYFDALGGDDLQVERFLCSQTVMLGLKGVPAVYFHSLTATPNDLDGVQATGQARSINRKKWNADDLEMVLNGDGPSARVFSEYRRLLTIRTQHAVFHPDASQTILQLDSELFGFTRTSLDGSETLAAISNFSTTRKQVLIGMFVPALNNTSFCIDILSGARISGTNKPIIMEPYQTVWLIPG